MVDKLEGIRNEIRESFMMGEFFKTLSLSKKYLKKVQKIHRSEYDDVRDDMFFATYYIGFMYKKMGNVKQAMFYTKLSIRYAVNDSSLNKSRWLLGVLYELANRDNKAIENYKQCIRYYREIKKDRFRGILISNIGKVLNKPNHMLKVAKILQNKEDNLYVDELRNTDTYTTLKTIYEDIIEVYSRNKEEIKIFQLLHNISDKNLRKELINLIQENKIQTA